MNQQYRGFWRSPWLGLGTLGSAIVLLGSGNPTLAQSEGTCFLTDDNGIVYDLSALCGSGSGAELEPVLQTGDVQVTLRWNTIDDLDLFVTDPAGDIVGFSSPLIPSGGTLDVDANGACSSTTSNPVENIFWPTGQSPTGEFTVEVSLFSYCRETTDALIPFTVTVLVRGQAQTFSSTLGGFGATATFSFTAF